MRLKTYFRGGSKPRDRAPVQVGPPIAGNVLPEGYPNSRGGVLMRAYVTARHLLFCGLLMASLILATSPASRADRVRGTGSYGSLTHQQISAPTIGGSGAGILSDTLYQCQNGTGCPIDLNIPGTSDACSTVFSDSPSGSPASCYDLLVTINPGTTFTPGSTLTITLANFTNPTDQFGLVMCGGGGDQDFGSLCVSSVPSACRDALNAAPSSITGTVSIPTDCLVEGFTFYFDETSPDNAVTSSFVPGVVTSTPEPNSFVLLGFGLASLALFSKRLQRA